MKNLLGWLQVAGLMALIVVFLGTLAALILADLAKAILYPLALWKVVFG